MNAKATVALAGALGLLIGLYFLTGYLDIQSNEREALLRRAFEFQANDVVEIAVERAGELPVKARRTAASWQILEPHAHIPANEIVWNRLADAIAKLSHERIIDEDPKSLDQYEMDPPHLRVEFETASGEPETILAGAVDPTQEYRYFRVGDGPIGLTETKHFHELNRPLDQLRETLIVPPSEAGIDRIEYARIFKGGITPIGPARLPEIGDESVKVVVQRDQSGKWTMLEPVGAPARQSRVLELVKEVQFARGRSYVDAPESLADYGLDPPDHRITIRSGAQTRSLELGWAADGDKGAGIFAKLAENPSVFVIDGHILTLIPETPEAFRQTQLLAGEAVNLQTIRYTDDNATFTLANDPQDGWQFVEPPYTDIDQDAVSSFIAFLKGTGGLSFPADVEDTGFDSPRIALDMRYADGNSTRILVGDAVPELEPSQFYALQEDGATTTLPLEAVLVLRKKPFSFRKKDIFAFRAEDAREIQMTLDGTAYTMKLVGGRWVVSEPAEHMLESQADARALLEALVGTKATAVADPAPSSDIMGLDDPVFAVTLTMEPDGALHGPMQVGETIASSARERFIRVAGRDEIFYVDQDLIDEVRAAVRGIVPR